EAAEAALIETLEVPPGAYVPSTRASAGDTPGRALDDDAGGGAVLRRQDGPDTPAAVAYRRAGDKYLLVEYGPLVLDLRLRFRVHSRMSWLAARGRRGLRDVTPGIRSLQIPYESRVLSEARLLDALASAERELPPVDDVVVPTRVVHLPLSWDDPQTRLA